VVCSSFLRLFRLETEGAVSFFETRIFRASAVGVGPAGLGPLVGTVRSAIRRTDTLGVVLLALPEFARESPEHIDNVFNEYRGYHNKGKGEREKRT